MILTHQLTRSLPVPSQKAVFFPFSIATLYSQTYCTKRYLMTETSPLQCKKEKKRKGKGREKNPNSTNFMHSPPPRSPAIPYQEPPPSEKQEKKKSPTPSATKKNHALLQTPLPRGDMHAFSSYIYIHTNHCYFFIFYSPPPPSNLAIPFRNAPTSSTACSALTASKS